MDFWEWLQSIIPQRNESSAQQPLVQGPAPTRRSWNEQLSTDMVRSIPVQSFSLSGAIQRVLSTNQSSVKEVRPDLLGGRNNPVILPQMNVSIPLEEVIRQDPFIQDTLKGLVGPGDLPLNVTRDYSSAIGGRFIAGRYVPASSPLLGEQVEITPTAVRTLSRNNLDENITHEYGHGFDYRRINPELSATVSSYYPEYFREASRVAWDTDNPFFSRDDYAAVSTGEFFAENFDEAIQLLRYPEEINPGTIANLADRKPGMLLILKYLVDTPYYDRHELAPFIRSIEVRPPMLPAVKAQR